MKNWNWILGLLLAVLMLPTLSAAEDDEALKLTDLEMEMELLDGLGLFYVMQNAPKSPPPPERPDDAPDDWQPPFDPTPKNFNLRFIDNRFVLIFLNAKNLVTKSETVERISVQYEPFDDNSQREALVLSPAADGLYWTSPRFVPPPLRYKVRLIIERTPPDVPAWQDPQPEAPRDIYGFQMLNQVAQESDD